MRSTTGAALKAAVASVDPLGMQPEIQRALVKAGLKLGAGLGLVAAVVGLRVATAPSDGVESAVAQLESLRVEIEAERSAADAGTTPDKDEPGQEDSLVARLGADWLPGRAASPKEAAVDEQLVSCRLGGRTHFMRAGDCAMRGGRATVLREEP
ncbi:MAG: hypothetical protein JRG86_06030 [Deltaproteobacteria bacterium]|nr:hypothetical protein [Deltaproteobacteria bacterium]